LALTEIPQISALLVMISVVEAKAQAETATEPHGWIHQPPRQTRHPALAADCIS
jgi:hypothetical protein